VEGYNGRLDAMQAGFLHVKLSRLEQWNEQRRERADIYNRLLKGSDAVLLPWEPSWSRSVYHLYVIRTSDRDGMIRHLAAQNIGTGIHYPVPLHMQKAYRSMGYAEADFPVAAQVAREIVSLPMYPQLTAQQQNRVAEEVLAFVAETGHKRAAAPSFSGIAAEQTA
jgi:dTDP-4-amino-4,6-dideoxygalactose transaminase